MADKNNGKYRVVLIEEGLGNLGTKFYYSREALQYAADNKVFEGKKQYANHPSLIEEQVLPERSVRDIVGFYENVSVEDGPAGQALLMADNNTMPGESFDWVRTLIECAIDNAGRFNSEIVGVSINAGGESSKKSIDDLLQSDTLPISARPKLLKAQAEGITEVEYCTALKEAVSVDMVTEAGARGRFVKMLESERKRMATKKENDVKKEGTPPPPAADGKAPPAPGGDHADADQDKELIQSMMKKYLGDGEHSEEVHEAMHQAYQAALEMGHTGEKAQDVAGHSMMMAKHAAEKAAKEAKQKKEGKDGVPPPAAGGAAPTGDEDDDKKMESNVIKLQGEVAGLTKKLRERDVAEFLEKTIKGAGLEGKIAKSFRESIGKVESEQEITAKFKIFKTALEASSGGPVFLNPEKTSDGGESSLSFADCVKE